MNPNSQNQWWGKWVFIVRQASRGHSRMVTRAEVETHFARFARSIFGSAGQARLDATPRELRITVLVEGGGIVPHDPFFLEHVRKKATEFFVKGLGAGIQVAVESKLMAGSRQDGTPSEQMLVLPSIIDSDLKGVHLGKRTLQSV